MSDGVTFFAAAEVVQTALAAAPFWWVSPLIIAISAVAAGIISLTSIKANREIARKRATLDLIERSESTPHYQALSECFSTLRKEAKGFAQLYEPTNPEVQKQRQKVIAFLNHYELVAIGCAAGVLDEEFYKGYMRKTLVRDWEAAKGFVEHLRGPSIEHGTTTRHPTIYCQFEALATKWGATVQYKLPLDGNEKK